MERLSKTDDFDLLLDEPFALVFKHSTMCGLSAIALREAEKFLRDHPEHKIYKVEVLEARPVSDYIEDKTGIRHESPQILVLRNGEVVWHGSHSRVTAEVIASQAVGGRGND